MSAVVFSASVFSSTKSVPLIVSVDLSGYVIVAVPSSPTSTVVPSGNLSLFASSIAFLTAFFSSSVNLALFATFVFAGTAGSVLSAVVFSLGVFALSVPASDSLFEPSFAFAVTSVPSFTLSAGIVTSPEDGSIFRPLSAGNDQLP